MASSTDFIGHWGRPFPPRAVAALLPPLFHNFVCAGIKGNHISIHRRLIPGMADLMICASVRFLMIFSIVLFSAEVAVAQSDIGGAVRVENRVEGQLNGDPEEIIVNSPVFQNERIKTYADSGATFKLIDETTLSLGAASEIVLDRFVFDPDSSTGDMVFNAVQGAFRFVSGVAKNNSYRILTSVAAIGIRGTDFDVYVTRDATLVLGRQGAPFACPRRLKNELDPENFSCCDLDTGQAGTPLYGIITRRSRNCFGPNP
ncbi:MAG: hypothetical protein HKN60_05390, partial [Rhizobiales bacterium]|nr:hypothetical protein [Hyphomicrobiales bacterium]